MKKLMAAAIAAAASFTITACGAGENMEAAPAAVTSSSAEWTVDTSAPAWVARFRCQSVEKVDADLYRCFAPTYTVTVQRTGSAAEASAVVKDAPSNGIVAWSPGDKFVAGAKTQKDLDALQAALAANS